MINSVVGDIVSRTIKLLTREDAEDSYGDHEENQGNEGYHGHEGGRDGDHMKKHFANINYGYWVFVFSFIYLFFLYANRRFARIPSVSSFSGRILNKIYKLDPFIHMAIIFIPLTVMLPSKDFPISANKYIYIKRIGRLSYVLVTLNLIISLKPPIFPYLQDYTYDEFLPLHKWLSRFIFIIGILHSVLYFVKWAGDPSTFVAKCMKFENFVGIVIFILMIVLIISSLKPLRRRYYNLFYISHNIIYLVFVLLTPIHARPGVANPYLWVNIFILFLHCLNRIISCKTAILNNIMKETSPTATNTLSVINLPRHVSPDYFPPGTHLRISPYGRFNPLYWIYPSHPYTICSAPEEDEVRLIVAESTFKMMTDKTYTIQGCYPSHLPDELLKNDGQRILIVAGGSGIGYCLPVFRYFNQTENVGSVKLVWLIKDNSDIEFIKSNLHLDELKMGENFDVFITNNSTEGTSSSDENGEAFEMQTPFHSRRISWEDDLLEFVQHKDEKSWIISCGPESLVKDAGKFAKQHDVNFVPEYFSI